MLGELIIVALFALLVANLWTGGSGTTEGETPALDERESPPFRRLWSNRW
jgi:hypothetical protein